MSNGCHVTDRWYHLVSHAELMSSWADELDLGYHVKTHHFQVQDSLLLEGVQLEGELMCHGGS